MQKIKELVCSKLSGDQKAFLRLMYNSFKNPKRMNFNSNFYNYSKQKLRTDKLSYIPPEFIATITDNCNLRCPTCLYLLENPDKFTPSVISVDEFRNVLAKYNQGKKAESIFLTGGEPLMHPQFDELVNICNEYEMSTATSTNGILLGRSMNSVKKLDYVNVSVDSYDFYSFNKHRGGTQQQFDMLKESLEAIKKNNIKFSMSFLLSGDNVSEIFNMIEFAQSIGPDFVYFHNINPHGCEQYKTLTFQDQETLALLTRIFERDDYGLDIKVAHVFDKESEAFRDRKCIQPWYYFCFNSKGNISFCCHLEHSKDNGNVFDGYDFNSKKLVAFRKSIMDGKIMKSCLYCQRRFMEDPEFASFDSLSKKWNISEEYKQKVMNK